MYGSSFDPFSECWRFVSRFMNCGAAGRRFYTRKERIEQLEKLKKTLQDEISAIEEMIEDLKAREKH